MTDEESPTNGEEHLNPVIYSKRTRYPRAEAGLEFARVANFTDAVYAIALTLIVVELKPPSLDSAVMAAGGHEAASQLGEALWEMRDEISIFFIAFAVMGSYWFQSHRFFAGLRGVDTAYVIMLLPYLACVAFLPFPAATMGRYSENPMAVSTFAVTMGAVSFCEWLLLVRAQKSGLFFAPLTEGQYRWGSIGSLVPVGLFLLSVPVMLVTGSALLGFVMWALNVPAGFLVNDRIERTTETDQHGFSSGAGPEDRATDSGG